MRGWLQMTFDLVYGWKIDGHGWCGRWVLLRFAVTIHLISFLKQNKRHTSQYTWFPDRLDQSGSSAPPLISAGPVRRLVIATSYATLHFLGRTVIQGLSPHLETYRAEGICTIPRSEESQNSSAFGIFLARHSMARLK